MPLKILLVEDDYLQRNDAAQAMQDALGAFVETLSCEKDFFDGFEKIAEDPPDAAILDVMLMWSRPSRDESERPPDNQSPEQAGVRCATKLKGDPRTASVKVFLYSVLPEQEIGAIGLTNKPVTIVKEPDFQNLLDAIAAVFP